ncbi:MAG: M48 family metalloprotease [Mailhella sp.]|nr:M48 family metalloprotease [Mailhella sp.]
MAARLAAVFCILISLLVPVQGRAFLFGEFGLKEEMEMGREFDAMIRSTMPMIEDPVVRDYVQGLVSRIIRRVPPQPYAFSAGVIQNDILNAFASPGGFVFVFSGLIMGMEHEEELAAVLCHEVAHITQQHIAKQVERGRTITAASLLGVLAGVAAGVAGGGSAGGAAMVGSLAAGTSAMLKYSRIDEDEADRVGLQYLVRCGYSPRGMLGAFETLKKMDWNRSSAFPSYLTTHPDLETRLAGIRASFPSFSPDVLKRRSDDRAFLRIQALLMARHAGPDLARQYFSQKKLDDALRSMGRGILAARLNSIREAEGFFRQALASSPDDPLILREAGVFEYHKGDIHAALRHLERALDRSSRDYYGRFFYARALSDTGSSAEAQKHFKEVLRCVPKDSEVHFYFGRSLGTSGRTFDGFIHLAYASLYAGDLRMAKDHLSRARGLAKTPDDKKAIEGFDKRFEEYSKMLKKISREKQ